MKTFSLNNPIPGGFFKLFIIRPEHGMVETSLLDKRNDVYKIIMGRIDHYEKIEPTCGCPNFLYGNALNINIKDRFINYFNNDSSLILLWEHEEVFSPVMFVFYSMQGVNVIEELDLKNKYEPRTTIAISLKSTKSMNMLLENLREFEVASDENKKILVIHN